MTDLINTLLALAPIDVAQWIIFVAFILCNIIPHLPVRWTSAVPDWIMVIINILAMKYNTHKAKKTDMKGNAVEANSNFNSKNIKHID